MRKLTFKNKASFSFFGLIVIFIVALILFVIYTVLQMPRKEYSVDSNVYACSSDYQMIQTTSAGTLTQRWDQNYYLKFADEKSYNLSKTTFIYDAVTKKLSLYGKIAQVFSDGKVNILKDETVIKNPTLPYFYKLADRKYLITGRTITTEDNSFKAENFLLVVIDKAGKPMLINDKINVKTVDTLKLISGSFTFDVANEKLIYKENEIDLKKISGSTNTYKDKVEEDSKEEDNDSNKDENNQNNNANTNNSNNNVNNGGNNNQNSNVIQGGISGLPDDEIENDANNEPLYKSVSLRGITAGVDYLDISYLVIDPENKYQSVYLVVDDLDTDPIKIQLNKGATNYRLSSLIPNHTYKITLAYTVLSDSNDIIENYEDTMLIRTKNYNASLKIEKVTKDKVYYNLKLDSTYALESGKLVLYVDGNKENEVDIDINKALSSDGFKGSFTYNKGYMTILKVEQAMHNGNLIEFPLETKFIER